MARVSDCSIDNVKISPPFRMPVGYLTVSQEQNQRWSGCYLSPLITSSYCRNISAGSLDTTNIMIAQHIRACKSGAAEQAFIRMPSGV